MCVGQSVRKTYKWRRMDVEQREKERQRREIKKYRESEKRLTEGGKNRVGNKEKHIFFLPIK